MNANNAERLVSQLKEWEQSAFERSQDQTRKLEEQAYHLGKRDAYELSRLAIEREMLANPTEHREEI